MDLASPDTTRHYSREEFRRWCEAPPRGRYERMDGRIVATAPERGAHLRVKGAIYWALDRAVTVAGSVVRLYRTGANASKRRIVINAPIAMDPLGIVVSAEQIYGDAETA
jgi:hypothetical protein